MTAYGAKELEEGFRTVRKNTVILAEEIPAEKYDFKSAPGVRSVGEMLAHIAVAPRWQQRTHGDRLSAMDFALFGANTARGVAEEKALASKDDIVKALKEGGETFGAFLGGLSNDVLAERVSFPPPVQPSSKSRLEMLLAVKEHEMHHRAQLMLIQRQLGIVPHLTREREARMAAVQAGSPR